MSEENVKLKIIGNAGAFHKCSLFIYFTGLIYIADKSKIMTIEQLNVDNIIHINIIFITSKGI